MRRRLARFGWVVLGILAFGVALWPPTASAADKWIQIGSGIFSSGTGNSSGTHHQSGRLTQVSWAWDNERGHNVLWAGASHGGLWKSIIDDAGFLKGWVTLTDNFPGSHTLGSFAIKKGDSNYIVIGTGGSWGNGDGIYYTVNAGLDGWSLATLCSATWSCGPAKTKRVRRLVADRWDSTGATLVAATSDGVWESYDFGQTWFSRLSGVDVTDVVQDTGDQSRWYAGVVNEGIYLSTSYATSWAAYGKGIKGSISRISLAACDSDAQHLYALVVDNNNKLNGVYRSASRGDKWENVYSDNKTFNKGDQGGHTCAIVCDPSHPERIFVGLVQPAEIKIDTNGKKLTVSVNTFDGGHADYNFMLFSADGTHLHIANDGGYYFYDIATGTVNDVGNLLGLNNLELGGAKTTASYSTLQGGLASSWSNPEVFVAGLQDNGVVRGDTSKKDQAITLMTKAGDGRHVSIRPDDPDVFGFVDNDSSIRDLFDKGTIEDIDFKLSNEKSAPVLIDPTPRLTMPVVFTADQDPNVPAIAFYTNNVWYSGVLQGSRGWDLVSNDPITGPGVISHVDATANLQRYQIVATVAGDTRVFAYTGDRFDLGLLPLSEITPPLPSSPAPTQPDARINADRSKSRPNTLYYASGVGKPRKAYVSKGEKDFGKDWENVTGDIVSKSHDADLMKLIGNPGKKGQYFLATSNGVFRSDDGGATWKDYSDGLRQHEQVDDIVINFDNVSQPTLYVATRGRGFWWRTIE
jgi:hypothetical protein